MTPSVTIKKYISNINNIYQSDMDFSEKNEIIFDLFKQLELFLSKNIIPFDDEILNNIIKAKNKYINELKNNLFAKEETNLLKDIANEYEFIETSIIYSKNKKITISHDLVNKIIFEEKNFYHSKTLIERYPYMINMFNEKDNIILKIINNFIIELEKIVRNRTEKKDFYYYSEILNLILSNKKIKIDWDLIKIIDKIILLKINKPDLVKKKKQRYELWLKYLSCKLNKKEIVFSEDELNIMYDVLNKQDNNLLDEAYSIAIEKEIKKVDDSRYIITIDGDYTNDRDDALAVRKTDHNTYLLDVIIADPITYFGMDSRIIHNARFKNQTLYLSNTSRNSMFPEEIVTNYLSLDERKNRYVRIYSYEIDEYGRVISFSIKKSNTFISKNLTYNETDKILKSGDDNKKYYQKLFLLQELANIINKNFSYNTGDYDLYKINKSSKTSEKLIETFMIFNNYYVAKFFKEKNLPFVYRHHDMNKKIELDINLAQENSLTNLINTIESIGLSSDYSIINSNHDGLNLDYYSHTTSPIRRYADILASNCQDNYYFKKISDKESYDFENKLSSEVKFLNNRSFELLEYQISRIRTKK